MAEPATNAPEPPACPRIAEYRAEFAEFRKTFGGALDLIDFILFFAPLLFRYLRFVIGVR